MREKEIWKDVVGYEGFYKISSYGRLKRLGGYRKTIKKNGKEFSIFRPETILKSEITQTGHYRNDLYKHDGEKSIKERIRVNRLVAEAFIGKAPENKNHVNHINGNLGDNFYKNLEWFDGKKGSRVKKDAKRNCRQLSLIFE